MTAYITAYELVKNKEIRSKFKLADNKIYATLYHLDLTVSIVLTKDPVDIEWFRQFKLEVTRLSEIDREASMRLNSSFYDFNQNYNLLAIVEGVVTEEPANELLLDTYNETPIQILHIMWVSSSPYYSGNRFGVLLIYLLASYANSVKYITLDDDTDIAPINIEHMGKSDNIYYLIGFKHKKTRPNGTTYWKTWNPSNSIEGPERIISMSDFMKSREIVSIANIYTTLR